MDAIKITRGRTRRSQGGGDALGGPRPAAAGGGRAGRRCAAAAAPAAGAARGGAAERGTSSAGPGPESSPRAKEVAGGTPAPGRRRRQRGSGPGGRQGHQGPVPSGSRRRGLQFRLRTGEQRGGERRGGRRAALRFPRAGSGTAVRPCGSSPSELLLHHHLHNVLLECPSANASCEICPSVCLDGYLQP